MTHAENIWWDKAIQQRMDAGALTVSDHLLIGLADFTAALFPTMTTYIGSQIQNVKLPAVWVDFIQQQSGDRLSDESKYTFGVEITYMPKSEVRNTDELNHAHFLLLDNLGMLESDIGTFRVVDRNSNITDGLAHVTGTVTVLEAVAPDDTTGPIITKTGQEVTL